MNDDNVMPDDNSFWFPREPQDQVVERKKEQAKTLESLDVLKDLLKRMEERINFYEMVSNIPDEIRTDPQKFLIMHNAHTMTARSLRQEKEYLESLIDSYAKNK